MEKKLRQSIFFASIFFLFYLAVIGSEHAPRALNHTVAILLVGAIFTGVVIGLFYLTKLNDSIDTYKAFEISPGALCKGGAYMHQGDSAESQMCRAMATTPEGRSQIAAYNCPSGYIGQPGREFVYSSDSNDSWTSDKCGDKPKCAGAGNSLCSMGWDSV